jgi:amino acid adenylation domain-containing protein/non-ribosomal peptide synthase protein (TIGR01720 family)
MKNTSPDIDEPSDIDSLSPEQKRKLLADLLAKKAREVRYAPLSFAQQRLWFLDQFEPDSTAYNLTQALRLTGRMDYEALERGVNALVERHESLRTTFSMAEGEPVQVIAPSLIIPLPVVDLQDLSAEELETAVRQRVEEEASTPLDLSTGPLIRTTLLKTGPEEQIFLLTVHHIISDDWSMGILFRELVALYQGACEGKPCDLPRLPIQYADHAVWQRQWLQGETLEPQLAYWREQLDNLPHLDFPTDHPRPPLVTHHGRRHAFALSSALLEGIKAVSHEAGTSLFMTLLAAFHVLLARYSGQRDIAVGIPVANRGRPEVEGLIGFFINTLVLRADLSGDPSFTQVLHQVREHCLQAYSHQDVPFEKIVEELQPVRDPSRHPLFQVMFQVNQRSAETEFIPGLACVPVSRDQIPARFDLSVNLAVSPEDIQGNIYFNTDLFDVETMARLSRHFANVLAAIVEDPDLRIGELPLLRETERREMLAMGHGPRSACPEEECLQHLFARQATRRPEAVALVFESQRLTYQELNKRANQLARYLQRHGVGPESRVGLCLERSIEMVVAMMGILKAGGAYVPLDPNYPQERLAFQIADAGCSLVLTNSHLKKTFSDDQTRVHSLDLERETISGESDEDPGCDASANNLAYVIYTSGSTGRPNGVMVSHRSVCNHLRWRQSAYPLDESDGVLQKASIGFDISVWEIFAPLLSGARLVLAKPGGEREPDYLVRLIAEEGISLAHFSPAPFRVFLEQPDLDRCQSLRYVFCGGEALPVAQMKRFFSRCQGDLYHQYGPTEACIDATVWQCSSVDDPISLPIGNPITNVQVYILENSLQPVPIGVAGELYIGGFCLARGYAARPDLTAEKFVPDPFGSEPGMRLYRTGDRARYRADGTIEFLGRLDHQVKLRGIRIELGEIEAVLNRHPGVQDAVVAVREDEPGERRLVGYVVWAEEPVSPGDLRQFLKHSLPEYMVPAIFVTLDRMPLTPNGKVDRRALPAPEGVRPELDAAFQAPHPGVEQTLAELWKQILRIDQVGRRDNFFELGGDSILSIQIVAKANQAGLRVTPRQLFQYQTIAELAAVVVALEPVTADQGLVTGSLPLSPIQHWFFAQQLEGPHHWNMAWVLEARQPLDPEKMEQVVEALLEHHDALRLRFVPDGPRWKQELGAPSKQNPCTHVDLSHLPSAEAEAAFAEEADRLHTTLDLSEGPLIRVALFKFGGTQADRVLLVLHHLAVDGISWRILLDDLQTAYDQLCADEPIQLPPKTASFKEWTERLVEFAQSDRLNEEFDYWRTVADTPWTRLPHDSADGVNTVASTGSVAVELGRDDTKALLQEVPEVYHTQINDVLLAALADVLVQWGQQETVCLHLEGHGREELFEDLDLSRTVGWFTSMFPVLLKRGHPAHPGELLKSVKEQLRQIPARGIGYGLLRYLSDDGNNRGRLEEGPDPDVAFNYLGQFDQVIPSDGGWTRSGASGGAARDPRGRRSHLISINAWVMDGVLQVKWTYSEAVHRRETIESLANDYIAALLAIIRHCQSSEAGGYTPSDFPLAGVSQADLEKLL